MEPNSTTQSDVVVVGGGIAGLATATIIARSGKRVRVFEKARRIGGRAQTNDFGGFLMNLGPHALYARGAASKALHGLGITLSGKRPAPAGWALKDNRRYTLPATLSSICTTGLLSLSERVQLARIFAGLGAIDPHQFADISIGAWIERMAKSSTVRAYMHSISRVVTYANAPDQMSAGAVIEQIKLGFNGGVLYLDRGWQSIVDGLETAARDAGVTIDAGVKVARIDHNGSAKGVILDDGTPVAASAVVVAAAPHAAQSLIDWQYRSAVSEWVESAVPARVSCLDVALVHLPNPKATFAVGLDAPLYFSVHSAAARLAPEGGAIIHVAKYLGASPTTDAKSVEQELEQVLDHMQPGWRDMVVARRFLPNMLAASAIATTRTSGVERRPGPGVPGVRGLYIVGDWVGQEGQLADASLASANLAASSILSTSR